MFFRHKKVIFFVFRQFGGLKWSLQFISDTFRCVLAFQVLEKALRNFQISDFRTVWPQDRLRSSLAVERLLSTLTCSPEGIWCSWVNQIEIQFLIFTSTPSDRRNCLKSQRNRESKRSYRRGALALQNRLPLSMPLVHLIRLFRSRFHETSKPTPNFVSDSQFRILCAVSSCF